MQYPQDGGVSAIRHLLRDGDAPLALRAAAAISVGSADAGTIECVCRAPAPWHLSGNEHAAILTCAHCGAVLPLYIGPPPARDAMTAPGCPTCEKPTPSRAAVAIGYADETPDLGSLDAERAQELVVALGCATCSAERVAWELRLAAPYPVRGDEAWLLAIQSRLR